MELQLKNIGMIKEANVKIDGLTVIAGENDTGKSTVGKALFMFLNAHKFVHKNIKNMDNKVLTDIELRDNLFKKNNTSEIIETVFLANLIFKDNISDAEFILKKNNNIIHLVVDKDNFFKAGNLTSFSSSMPLLNPIIIETPLVWNFTDFFRDIAQVESQMRIELEYPYLMKDLNFKLHIKSASTGLDIKKKMTDLMGGEFKKDEMGRYYFDKQGQRVELVNTATGIKAFGIFQILSQNNYLNKDTVLVLDEPEVHLHPKWQLEMAKVIVELVKNGVKVLVNSHSPYMIEALERYAEKAEVPADFYFAENGIIDKVEENNSKTLAKIFNKLSAPYETFNKMDSEILKGG